MRVTVKQLERLGACEEQLNLVAMHWGKSVEVTPETCAEAAALGLDVEWAAETLLTDTQYDEYWAKCHPIDEYWAKRTHILDEYDAKRRLLDDEYWANLWQLFAEIATGRHAQDTTDKE